ncbi:hypothetical protein C8R44DRAFT_4924 [Mycena epipterygia]|nr:hypothetical protein C8R44DRAFT_4924 [Mycena epipterygia]
MSDAAPYCPDPLEKIFQQVEEQNERRAQQEAQDAGEGADTLGLSRAESSDNLRRSRRRGSISITRFGQLASSDDSSSAGPKTPALSDIAAKSPFYQAQLRNNSQTSFASAASAADDEEDAHHVTHMHTIAPRQSISRAVGGILRPRRARSSVLPGGAGGVGVVVGVATVELPADAARPATSVHAPGALRSQASRGSVLSARTPGAAEPDGGQGTSWATRAAQKFTKKFRRKAGAASP